ncbi:MAG: class I SAM-dependent methyltransferase [Imperialibacter sp.]|uniref:class I SAM-dependent methyltransferase n=1 Tax=Imperialibacter sp. TaxID=2038411 RepID=UPI003A87B437
MQEIKCPLDGKSKTRLIKTISTSTIYSQYQALLDINLDRKLLQQEFISLYESIDTGYKFFHPFQVAGDADFYYQLSKIDWYYLSWKWEYVVALEIIEKGTSVLEIGCGEGDFLFHLDQSVQSLGLEINSKAVETANSRGILAYKSTIEDFALKGERFDYVCFFQVLEHISDVNRFISSSLRCLRTDGSLILCVPNNDSFIKFDRDYLLNMPPHHMGLWNEKALKSLEKVFNLQLIQLKKEPLQEYHLDWFVRVWLIKLFGGRIFWSLIAPLRLHYLVKRVVRQRMDKIDGHSIFAVYRKL